MTINVSKKVADNIRLARSHTLAAPVDGSYDLIALPRYAFVMNTWVYISTAYADGGATITIGFKGNGESASADYFMASATADPDALGTKTGGVAKWFNDQRGMITVACDDNAGAAGTFIVFAAYTVLH